ncbi:MAG: sugar phosphate nucleotidyltransferase [Bacteroidales bacterium]|nr:sugar phosphate nucleotidyltransferase [Bacteroidales bacterium]
MNLIIPMAGIGKRLRPHTFEFPKPLFHIAGKSILSYLLESLTNSVNKKFLSINFIISKHFSEDIKRNLINLSEIYCRNINFFIQESPLGTAHALYCAKDTLKGEILIAFADTIFFSNNKINNFDYDGIIFVKEIENPSQYGIVITDENKNIKKIYEKPKTPLSNLAIIGIYFFKDGEILLNAINEIIEKNYKVNGEYQLTDALDLLIINNYKIKAHIINEWLDCGNKNSIITANNVILEKKYYTNNLNFQKNNSIIIEPSYIGKEVNLDNSIVGPYVSIHEKTTIKNCIIKNSIIGSNTYIENKLIQDSIIGNFSELRGEFNMLNIGNYTYIND